MADEPETKSVEERFREWKEGKTKGHPLYQTANRQYGVAPKGVEVKYEKPTHGRVGGFSTTFVGSGPYRDTGLSTAVSKSRVHSALDAL